LPAARNTGARMPKQLVQTARFSLASAADPGPLAMIAVAVVGLGFLVAEGAVLSAQGVHGIVYALIAVFAASTVSSIAGFAFSALCGALLFHLMDSPVYAVHVMIVCSIAIQILSVATLWRTIEWRCLRIFLIGGFLGVPAGVYLLLHLPSTTYRTVIGSLLIIYGSYLLLRPPARSLRLGRVSDVCAGISRRHHRGAGRFPRGLCHYLVRLEGMGQGAPARRVSALHPRNAAGDPDHNPSDAAGIVRAGAARLEDVCLRPRRLARRVVRPAHFQAALGPTVRIRRQRIADRLRHRTRPLNEMHF